jgi:DNA-binding transcriptional MerR regulator
MTQSPKDRSWSISQLAREFGVTARALRFYEDKDLLHPARDGMNRIFSARDRARLQLILRGKRVGFTLEEIREILDLYDLHDGQQSQLRLSLVKFRERVKILERQREDIAGAIETLQERIGWIEQKLAANTSAEEASARAFDTVARKRLAGMAGEAALDEAP